MEIELRARHVELTDRVRDYVDKKVGRIDRHLPDLQRARIELSHGVKHSMGEVYTTQITAYVKRRVLRAEETNPDLFASIDMAAAKLNRQVERFRGRRLDRWHEHRKADDALPDMAELEDFEDEEPRSVVRRKRFAMHPMNEEEAIEQLDLLGHDFFLFMNGDSGEINVLYRRKDGDYGLIEPVLA